LKLTTLEGDLIEVFKIFKGFEDLDPNVFFDLSNAHKDIIACGSINTFKNRIDNFLYGRGINF